ncbi:hypothetical protein EV424DRAFT_1352244 [Suillus variegatus]|nr:hypothetical protein EV424DRAFT_1352244 [Suillus variegatus]
MTQAAACVQVSQISVCLPASVSSWEKLSRAADTPPEWTRTKPPEVFTTVRASTSLLIPQSKPHQIAHSAPINQQESVGARYICLLLFEGKARGARKKARSWSSAILGVKIVVEACEPERTYFERSASFKGVVRDNSVEMASTLILSLWVYVPLTKPTEKLIHGTMAEWLRREIRITDISYGSHAVSRESVDRDAQLWLFQRLRCFEYHLVVVLSSSSSSTPLLVQQRGREYKSIAPDHNINAQVKDLEIHTFFGIDYRISSPENQHQTSALRGPGKFWQGQ